MSELFSEAADFLGGIVRDIEEEVFPPRPGGKVDSARRDRLRDEAYQEYVKGQEKDSERPRPVMKYQPTVADTGSAVTVTLSSVSPSQMILPRDFDRRNAVVLAVANDVWLSTSPGMAADIAGQSASGGAFYLPAGVPVPVTSTAPLWAAATTTATATRVSVMIAKDSAA